MTEQRNEGGVDATGASKVKANVSRRALLRSTAATAPTILTLASGAANAIHTPPATNTRLASSINTEPICCSTLADAPGTGGAPGAGG